MVYRGSSTKFAEPCRCGNSNNDGPVVGLRSIQQKSVCRHNELQLQHPFCLAEFLLDSVPKEYPAECGDKPAAVTG